MKVKENCCQHTLTPAIRKGLYRRDFYVLLLCLFFSGQVEGLSDWWVGEEELWMHGSAPSSHLILGGWPIEAHLFFSFFCHVVKGPIPIFLNLRLSITSPLLLHTYMKHLAYMKCSINNYQTYWMIGKSDIDFPISCRTMTKKSNSLACPFCIPTVDYFSNILLQYLQKV